MFTEESYRHGMDYVICVLWMAELEMQGHLSPLDPR